MKGEKKVPANFSIEREFKDELERLFADMGLCWAAGVRFALREFVRSRKVKKG